MKNIKKFRVLKTVYIPNKRTSVITVNKENSILNEEELQVWINTIKDRIICLKEGEEYEQIDFLPPAEFVYKSSTNNCVLYDIVINNLAQDKIIDIIE